MARRFGAWAKGSWVTLTTPAWLRGGRLRSLMNPVSPGGTPRSGRIAPSDRITPSGDPAEISRAALAVLRGLSSIPLSPWKNTCLYRSVAVCRCLRRHGIDACLRLGVRGEAGGGEETGISAHAWVEVDSPPDRRRFQELIGSGVDHVPFRARSRPDG